MAKVAKNQNQTERQLDNKTLFPKKKKNSSWEQEGIQSLLSFFQIYEGQFSCSTNV